MTTKETLAQQQERERQENEIRFQKACSVLQRLLIKSIVVHYDGSGDEGFIDKMEYTPMPTAGIPEGLRNLIEFYVDSQLPPGWELNSGSFGTMTIEVATRKATLEHQWKPEELEDEGEEIDG